MAIDPVYFLALVILGGVATTKREFLPHAAGVVLILLVLNTLRSSMFPMILRMTDGVLEEPKLRKVLKPDVYQNFELAEKNVISHNTAS